MNASATLLGDGDPRRVSGTPWRGIMVGLALAIPMVILLSLAVGALLDVGPFQFGRGADTPIAAAVATPMDVSGALSATPVAGGAFVPTATVPATAGAEREPSGDAATPQTAQATAVAPAAEAAPGAPPAEIAVQTAVPTPAGDINVYWQDAQALFAEAAWSQAADFLTLVQRIDADFERVRVSQMLYESHLRDAIALLQRGDSTAAATALQQSAALRPDDADAQALAESARALVAQPDSAAQPDGGAANALRAALGAEAAARLAQNDPCAAADILEAAITVAQRTPGGQPARGEVDTATDVRSLCTSVQQAQEDEVLLASLPGRLLYSTQTGPESYRIYVVNAAAGASASEVIADGRQPALAPDGARVAFHSTRPDIVGIAGFDLDASTDPSARAMIYTRGIGDAVDSPPSWSSDGSRLLFASVDPVDKRSRIYSVAADGRDTPLLLRPGLSPAWNPVSDLIVYNGADDTGQQPGLWLMQPNGQDATPLTANSADNRPAWSPDGGTIVFMSNGRSSDWDLFSLNLATGVVMQLTTEGAQDGLPTISPDGQYVAFVSDRGGAWNIWVKPLAGGRTLLLSPIEGSLTNWLEHSLQWIP